MVLTPTKSNSKHGSLFCFVFITSISLLRFSIFYRIFIIDCLSTFMTGT